jgi:hypothetical protein
MSYFFKEARFWKQFPFPSKEAPNLVDPLGQAIVSPLVL